jgi:hypothetical protein
VGIRLHPVVGHKHEIPCKRHRAANILPVSVPDPILYFLLPSIPSTRCLVVSEPAVPYQPLLFVRPPGEDGCLARIDGRIVLPDFLLPGCCTGSPSTTVTPCEPLFCSPECTRIVTSCPSLASGVVRTGPTKADPPVMSIFMYCPASRWSLREIDHLSHRHDNRLRCVSGQPSRHNAGPLRV